MPADQREQLELRQPLEQRPRESDPLSDRDHHLRVGEALGELVGVARRFAKPLHFVATQQLEALQPVHNILIIVGDGYAHGEH